MITPPPLPYALRLGAPRALSPAELERIAAAAARELAAICGLPCEAVEIRRRPTSDAATYAAERAAAQGGDS